MGIKGTNMLEFFTNLMNIFQMRFEHQEVSMLFHIAYVNFQKQQREKLTRERSQFSASDLAETHTTYKEPRFMMNPIEIFCKWPPAKRPEATKGAKMFFEKFQKIYFWIFEIVIL